MKRVTAEPGETGDKVKRVTAKSRMKTLALPVVAAYLVLPQLLQVVTARAVQAQTITDHQQAAAVEHLSFEPLPANAGILGLNYAIGSKGYPTISDILKGSPADKAALKIGDEIISVGDKDTRFTGYLHLQPLLSGDSGTQVTLKLRHADGNDQTVSLTRAAAASFKDANLHKYEVAKWHGDQQGNASDHLHDHLIDLPFALLSREHNRPTLFEFVDKDTDPGVLDLLKKHSDSAYILGQCKVVRIPRSDADYGALSKYLSLTGSYALIPVYQPWLVTVKASDVITSLPSNQQLDAIAKSLVHNSIKVQVSHTVAKQQGNADSEQRLNKRAGLAHKTVYKRICQPLPAASGIVGLGFAAGSDGYAIITQVFAKGPGEKAGIKEGDRLLAVDGQDTKYLGLEHIQAALTGPVGHTVTLLVTSPADRGKISAAAKSTSAEKPGASEGQSKSISLKFEPIATFNDPSLTKITVSIWKQVISSNADDSDEYELPCTMLARAKDRPTIFEFCDSESGPSLESTINSLKKDNRLPNTEQNLQLVRYTPKDKDFETLRKYFKLTSTYACLPVYCRTRHKTFKANQIISELPSPHDEKDMERLVEKLMPEQQSKAAHNDAKVAH